MIIPSVLSDNLEVIQTQINKITRDTDLKRIQTDIVERETFGNQTIEVLDIKKLDLRGLRVDVHLMTKEPQRFIEISSQVPEVKMIIGQIEYMSDQNKFVEKVKASGLQVGLCIDGQTQAQVLDENAVRGSQALQVMGIRAGAQGREFIGEPILSKLHELANKFPSLEILVDGGIRPQNAKEIIEAGASGLVVGSFLWKSPDLRLAVELLETV